MTDQDTYDREWTPPIGVRCPLCYMNTKLVSSTFRRGQTHYDLGGGCITKDPDVMRTFNLTCGCVVLGTVFYLNFGTDRNGLPLRPQFRPLIR